MSLCASRYCQYNLPGQTPKIKINFIKCPLCKITLYCSSKCRDYDWSSSHKMTCHKTDTSLNSLSVSLQQESSEVTTLRQMRRAPEEFEIVHQGGVGVHLGKGSYGAVKLVKDKTNGVLYAMKIMDKKEVFEYCSTENLKREIRIQKKLDHPHVTKLYHYFEDKEYVYLILEYAQNGSLYSHLRRCKIFPENEAFVYFFQTCLGIDYLHKKQILHRDLKPENLLLDDGGNIKICDFGWSAENLGKTQKRTTFCGTIDYMAPEMIENRPHDHTLDLWCLGILLYELVHGSAPFKGRNDIEKCNNIVKSQAIQFDAKLSWDLKDLITGLLKHTPSERISMDSVFSHSWMQKIAKQYGVDIASFVYVESSWKQQVTQSLKQPITPQDGKFSSTSTNSQQSFQKSEYFMSASQQNQSSSQPLNQQSAFEDIMSKTRISRKSRRQEIVSPPKIKEKSVFDKFLVQLGCVKRE